MGTLAAVATTTVFAVSVDGSMASLKTAEIEETGPSEVELPAGDVARTVGGVVSIVAAVPKTGSTQ